MVLSVVLIVVAVVLLAAGLWQPSAVLLSASIAASLLAAIALVAGARRLAMTPGVDGLTSPAAPRRRPPAAAPRHLADYPEPEELERSGTVDNPLASAADGLSTVTIPTQGGASRPGVERPDDTADQDPPDEPAPQQVSAADAARVGQMSTEVLVVDGRPRYHLAGCVHLLGRDHEPIPVSEAISLGFTPCSLCEPDSALLADARRV